jgi:micrococcal nuclease
MHPKQNLLLILILPVLIVFIGSVYLVRISDFGEQSQSNSSCNRGMVVVVYDGDTIKVRFDDGSERKVRLIGIDSPEIEDEREDIRLFAYVAKRFSFDHLYRKQIRLTFDWEHEDKYGRLLAYVWLDRETLFNELILKEGYASAFLKFPFNNEYRRRFVEAERTARRDAKGLWQREPLPTIASSAAGQNLRKYISVKFKCVDIRSRGRLVFLHSPDVFSAIIPRSNLSLFPDLESFRGRWIVVKGYLEKYKGSPQIVVFLPLQVK